MPEDVTQSLRQVLKEQGYSITAARLLVCELLWGKEPQTMRQLVDQLQGRTDRASLYRTMALFEKLGLINRIYIGWKYKIELSDLLTHHHHHISCQQCGKIEAIREEHDIERLIDKLSKLHDFQAQQHTLEIRGLCQQCQTASG